MTTKSSGFTLIELLVVVAILGILAAVGVAAYSGYVDSAKKKSTENIMMQIGLAQTEHYSDFGVYYPDTTGSCTPTETTSKAVEKDLLGAKERGIITEDLDFEICVEKSSTVPYLIKAQNDSTPPCVITVDSTQAISRSNC